MTIRSSNTAMLNLRHRSRWPVRGCNDREGNSEHITGLLRRTHAGAGARRSGMTSEEPGVRMPLPGGLLDVLATALVNGLLS